jgi:hypothetical protein
MSRLEAPDDDFQFFLEHRDKSRKSPLLDDVDLIWDGL